MFPLPTLLFTNSNTIMLKDSPLKLSGETRGHLQKNKQKLPSKETKPVLMCIYGVTEGGAATASSASARRYPLPYLRQAVVFRRRRRQPKIPVDSSVWTPKECEGTNK